MIKLTIGITNEYKIEMNSENISEETDYEQKITI